MSHGKNRTARIDEDPRTAAVLCVRAWIVQTAESMKETHRGIPRQEDLLTMIHSNGAKAESKIE